MAKDVFDGYLSEINEAFLRGDATEHTHRLVLKALVVAFAFLETKTSGIVYLKRES